MAKLTKVLEVEVIYSLPEWTCDERFNYEKRRIIPKGHRYAGQVDWNNIEYGNTLHNAFWKRFKPDEMCTMAEGPWARIIITGRRANIPKKIVQVESKIERFLHRYRESREINGA